MGSASSGGLNAEEIRLCYRYVLATDGQGGMTAAKKRFREMSLEEKRQTVVAAHAWAARFPKGEELSLAAPAGVRGRPRRAVPSDNKPYSVLLPAADVVALHEMSQKHGESVSFHIREAIRRYLRDSRKGA